MSFFVFPAGLALIAKVVMLISQFKLPWVGQKWIGLVCSLAALNLAELLAYSAYSEGIVSDYLLRFYYAFCLSSLLYSYAYICDPAKYAIQKIILSAHLFLGGLLGVAFLLTSLMIDGAVLNGTYITANKSVFFWVFEIFAVSSVILSLGTLFYNYKKAESKTVKIAYVYTIFGLAPLALCIIVIISMIALGYGANGSAIIPVATTVFLFISAKGRNSHLLDTDPRTLNPFSEEAALNRVFQKVQTQSVIGNMALKDAIETIELELIEYTLAQHQGNMSQTAQSLGVSRSTLYGRLKTLAKHKSERTN